MYEIAGVHHVALGVKYPGSAESFCAGIHGPEITFTYVRDPDGIPLEYLFFGKPE